MLTSYKNDIKLKTMLLEEVAKHRKLDQITQGIYGDPKNPDSCDTWESHSIDDGRLAFGNCFPTEKKATEARYKVKELLLSLRK